MEKFGRCSMLLAMLFASAFFLSSCQSNRSAAAKSVTMQAAPEACYTSPQQQAEALKLDFREFDQTGGHPASARDLAMKGCHTEAAYIIERYLVKHSGLSRREVDVLIWHLGQHKARLGRYEVASSLFLSTLRSPEDSLEPDNFDWNAYVLGSWAFLNKEETILKTSIDTLLRKGGQRNLINARALIGLHNCFDKPYSEALSSGICQASTVTHVP